MVLAKERVVLAEKNKVEIRIAGNDYTLVGTESDEYIQKIGLYIDRKMNEIMRSNSKLSTSMAAILTAVNVADDYFKASDSDKQVKRDLKRVYEELQRLKEENKNLAEENTALINKSTNLQLELAKREAELTEVRGIIEKLNKEDALEEKL